MKKNRSHRGYLRLGVTVTGTMLAMVGCSAEGDDVKTNAVADPIIAGVPANGAKLNAIGSIGYMYYDPYSETSYYQPYCSGSLVGKQTVLTAKHCLGFFASDYANGSKTYFAVGPDAFAPQKLLEVVAVEGAPVDQGGFVDYGHDVGVMYLGEKVADLTPLKLGALKPQDLSKKFVEIGYGVRDNTWAYGTRRTGNATLRATSGKVFEIIFGSFERFNSWFETGSPGTEALFVTGPVAPAAFLPLARSLYAQLGPAALGDGGAGGEPGGTGGKGGSGGTSSGGSSPVGGAGPVPIGGDGGGGYDEYLRYLYDNIVLTEGYEAVFGGAEGDAQACYGDSGSPIVRANTNGELVAYGVISGGIGSSQLICDYGGVDSVFGPDVMTFLTAAQKWIDPCKGVSIEGACNKTTATRCTSPLEGPRRLVKFDCKSLGQTCAIQTDGTAGCSDP